MACFAESRALKLKRGKRLVPKLVTMAEKVMCSVELPLFCPLRANATFTFFVATHFSFPAGINF